jgi:xylulokinase
MGATRHMRIMERIAGRRLERVIVSGVGAKTELWLRIKASCFGVPILVPQEPECGVIGCAALAAAAPGRFRSAEDAAAAMVAFEREILHDPRWSEVFARMQRVFEKFYRHSQALYADLDSL